MPYSNQVNNLNINLEIYTISKVFLLALIKLYKVTDCTNYVNLTNIYAYTSCYVIVHTIKIILSVQKLHLYTRLFN